MPYTFYQILWIFLIYSFLGWCAEVAFATVSTGKFINRGFLIGPVCPIYGTGILIVLLSLIHIEDNILILFVGSVFLTTILEFITGFVLEKVFHQKWWEYDNEPFNIKGYICLKASLMWGLLCLLVIKVFHPLIMKGIEILPLTLGITLLCIFFTVFTVDSVLTIAALCRFKRNIKIVNELEKNIKVLSEAIGAGVSGTVSAAINASEKSRHELDKLKEKLVAITSKNWWTARRIFRAFPQLDKSKISSFFKRKDK